MTITLNHTVVPSRDNRVSAAFYCQLFGFKYLGEFSHFIVVRVNDTLCLDFDNSDRFESHHYAFKVTEQEFDTILQRLQDKQIPYGSGPFEANNMEINHHYGGRGTYFYDPSNHLLEILTTDYEIPPH
ncbi:MAG: VOC family protein [Nitrosomonas sp.]|nr:VOC family protein [Nitrosomonas sp.]